MALRPHFFDGLSPADLDVVLAPLERWFPAGGVQSGEEAAEASIPRLAAVLPWLRG